MQFWFNRVLHTVKHSFGIFFRPQLPLSVSLLVRHWQLMKRHDNGYLLSLSACFFIYHLLIWYAVLSAVYVVCSHEHYPFSPLVTNPIIWWSNWNKTCYFGKYWYFIWHLNHVSIGNIRGQAYSTIQIIFPWAWFMCNAFDNICILFEPVSLMNCIVLLNVIGLLISNLSYK